MCINTRINCEVDKRLWTWLEYCTTPTRVAFAPTSRVWMMSIMNLRMVSNSWGRTLREPSIMNTRSTGPDLHFCSGPGLGDVRITATRPCRASSGRKKLGKRGEKITDSLDTAHTYQPGDSLTHLATVLGRTEPWASEWNSRLDQSFSPLPRVTRESVRQYLQFRPDQSVRILHAKVAQKSYGNEKRFFCPPPCVYISGSGWKLKQDLLKATGAGDSCYRLCGYMGLDSSCVAQADTFKLAFEDQPDARMFACAKSLYISDTDKRKHFRLVLKLFLGNGQEIGSFLSKLIKVISKPSQKRQSMKNADLCISAGSRVALFNRLRSQTVSTRYLAVERGAFVASARQWTAFTVTLVEDQHADSGEFTVCEGFICYGCVVQLVCTDSGVALPPMVIRKVNKQHTILDVDEPVSQLHKCAFQFKDNSQILREQSREVLNDGSCWTIIGTEAVEYTFSEGLACVQGSVSPIPVITGLEHPAEAGGSREQHCKK
ncbi:unnamed protein product [Coregonus sp. 'balchen']|nr:unnamed protein product [Coregonus sp. 'balchen']